MLTSLLTAHHGAIFWTGVGLEVIGQVWLLFMSYRCDVSLARWTLFFPPLALFLAIRYPEECLKPVAFCLVAAGFIWLGDAYGPHAPPVPASEQGLPVIPELNQP